MELAERANLRPHQDAPEPSGASCVFGGFPCIRGEHSPPHAHRSALLIGITSFSSGVQNGTSSGSGIAGRTGGPDSGSSGSTLASRGRMASGMT